MDYCVYLAVDMPATGVLGKDLDGDPPNCACNYASVIGMLWCLCGHSRCDSGFAVCNEIRGVNYRQMVSDVVHKDLVPVR